jgi:hypothetical protein
MIVPAPVFSTMVRGSAGGFNKSIIRDSPGKTNKIPPALTSRIQLNRSSIESGMGMVGAQSPSTSNAHNTVTTRNVPGFLSHAAVNEMSKTLITRNPGSSKKPEHLLKTFDHNAEPGSTYSIKDRQNLPDIQPFYKSP